MIELSYEQVMEALEPTQKQKDLITKLGSSYKGLNKYECITLIKRLLADQRMISGLDSSYFDEFGDLHDEFEGWFKMSDFI